MKNNYYPKIINLAWTMILCNITVPLLGLVDTMMMGHQSQSYYLAAVGVGASIFDFMFWGFGFLRMGTTGLVAQLYGKSSFNDVKLILLRASLLALGIALLLLMIQGPLIHGILWIISPPDIVRPYILTYFYIRIWSAPAILLSAVMLGWFVGMQNTRIPLLVVTVTNIIGIGCDVLFVYGFHMKVSGVAFASLIAQYGGLIVYLLMARSILRRQPSNISWSKIFHKEKCFALFHLNKNIFLRTICLIFAFGFFVSQGSRLGQTILAANVVLMNFQMISAFGLDGFITATEALVGKALGENNRVGFNAAIKASMNLLIAFSLIIMLIYFIFGPYIINMLTSIKEINQTALKYLPFLAILPFVSLWGYLFDGVFIGATKSREMFHTMLVSLCFFLIMWYCLRGYGNYGLWTAFLGFMLMRGLSMAIAFKRLSFFAV